MLASASLDGSVLTLTLSGYGDSAVLTVDGQGYIHLNGGSAIALESAVFAILANGTSGPDLIDIGALSWHYVSLNGGAGNDTLVGCLGYGEINGDDGDDLIVSSGSGLYLRGGEGNDTLHAGYGDHLDGGPGDDWLFGTVGPESLDGGSGNDRIWGGWRDTICGGEGDDTIFALGDGYSTIDGGPGADTLLAGYGAYGNWDNLESMPDWAEAWVQDDELRIAAADSYGSDIAVSDGGEGWVEVKSHDQTLAWFDSALFSGIRISLENPAEPNQVFVDTAIPTTVHGCTGDDFVQGGDGPNSIWLIGGGHGYWGDYLLGGPGDDYLDASAAGVNTYVRGQDGNDTVVGSDAGDGWLWGDYGSGEYDGDDLILAGSGGWNWIHGGPGADTIYAGHAGDSVWGDGGDDLLVGGEGDDMLDGGYGNDTLYGWGGGENGDSLFGGDGADTIYVQDGDSAYGGDGDDVFHVLGTGECVVDGESGEEDVALLDDDSEVEPSNVEYVWYPELWAVGDAVAEGEDYTLNLNGPEGLSLWTVDWGDGSELETTEDAQDELTHLYTTAPSGPIAATFTWNGREFAAWALWPEIVPISPSDLQVDQDLLSDGLVELSWNDNSEMETGFIVEQGTPDGNGGHIFSVLARLNANTTAYRVPGGLAPSASRTFRVKAYFSFAASALPEEEAWGVSQPSEPVTATLPAAGQQAITSARLYALQFSATDFQMFNEIILDGYTGPQRANNPFPYHYFDDNDDGTTWGPSAVAEDISPQPLGYTRSGVGNVNVVPTVQVTIKVVGPPVGNGISYEIRGAGVAGSGMTFVPTTAEDWTPPGNPDGAIWLTATLTATAPAPSTVDFFKTSIAWSVVLVDNGQPGTPMPVGTTEHPTYVTNIDLTNATLQTVVDIGCRNAKGLTDLPSIANAIWVDFAVPFPGVLRADGIQMRYDGPVLQAFKKRAMPADLAGYQGLVKYLDGDSQAWAEFLVAVWACQGVGATVWHPALPPGAAPFAVIDTLEGQGMRARALEKAFPWLALVVPNALLTGNIYDPAYGAASGSFPAWVASTLAEIVLPPVTRTIGIWRPTGAPFGFVYIPLYTWTTQQTKPVPTLLFFPGTFVYVP